MSQSGHLSVVPYEDNECRFIAYSAASGQGCSAVPVCMLLHTNNVACMTLDRPWMKMMTDQGYFCGRSTAWLNSKVQINKHRATVWSDIPRPDFRYAKTPNHRRPRSWIGNSFMRLPVVHSKDTSQMGHSLSGSWGSNSRWRNPAEGCPPRLLCSPCATQREREFGVLSSKTHRR